MVGRFFAVLVLLSGCQPALEKPVVASIPELLDAPAKHHKKLVRISGAAIVEFEGVFVCPDERSMDRGEPSECLWMNRADGSSVELVGRFDAYENGHMGLFGGKVSVVSAKVVGAHSRRGFAPPPPPSPSANNSSKPTPLRGAA